MSLDVLQRAGLSIDRLRSFVAVADAGGIARAAPRDPVRQSQLSRQVSELEQLFGQPLMRKLGRSLELNELGRSLAAVARATFAGLRDVALEAESAPVSFTLAAGDSVLHWWVMPCLPRVLGPLPRVALQLLALSRPQLLDHIADGRIDFALVRGGELPPSRALESRAVGKLELALFVPRALKQRLEELPLALQHSEPELNQALLRKVERAGNAAPPILWCETFPQVARAIATGAYAGLLPTLARGELPGSTERAVPSVTPKPFPMRLVWHARTARARAAGSDLIDALGTELLAASR